MRGRDEDTGEFRGASRSQQRREALEIFDLGEKLVALTPAQLAKLPVPESLIPHIEESKRITRISRTSGSWRFWPSTCAARTTPR